MQIPVRTQAKYDTASKLFFQNRQLEEEEEEEEVVGLYPNVNSVTSLFPFRLFNQLKKDEEETCKKKYFQYLNAVFKI